MLRLEEFMEIFRLKDNGYSLSAISRMTGIDRKTIRKYLSQGKNIKPTMKTRAAKESKLKRFEKDILNFLKYSDTDFPPCPAIYEKLVERGYTGSLSLLQKWMSQYRKRHLSRIVIRYETAPGEQAQVDWGEKKILDHRTGIFKKVYIFSMILSWSRMRFVMFTPEADMYYFLFCHVQAFRYFGGIPREILYDQNRCVLVKPGFKDVVFNNRFLDFAHHYDFIPRVCKPYRPQTKGKVENNIKYVKRSFLTLQDTHDIVVLNQRKKLWLENVNHKVHSTIQEIPYQRLPKENLNDFRKIPDYDLCYVESRRVFNDCTFSFYSKRYSVPPEYRGKTVTIKYKPSHESIDVYWNNNCITQHRTDSPDQYVIKRSHRHEIWKVWRDDKKLFYQQAQENKSENHPLSVYEEVSMEVSHDYASA